MIPSELVAAIVAGATVALKDTAAEAIKDAYAGLKSIIVGRHKLASIELLERDPNSDAFKAATEAEITDVPELLSDPELSAKIVAVYDAIEQNISAEELESVGIDVKEIVSRRDTIIQNIEGFTTGLKSDKIVSGQDTKIEGISGKSKT